MSHLPGAGQGQLKSFQHRDCNQDASINWEGREAWGSAPQQFMTAPEPQLPRLVLCQRFALRSLPAPSCQGDLWALSICQLSRGDSWRKRESGAAISQAMALRGRGEEAQRGGWQFLRSLGVGLGARGQAMRDPDSPR